MPDLHPQAIAFLAEAVATAAPTYEGGGILAARRMVDGARRWQSEVPEIALVHDILVAGGAGRLPARVYHPDPGSVRPLVVYLHGGGFVAGSVAAADRPCRGLAAASDCVVVSVEYRLAPENPYPAPVQDAVAALRWLSRHAEELGGDPQRMILVADSAGAAIGATAAHLLREADPSLAAQVLIYPTLVPARGNHSDSMTQNGEGYLMTRSALEWFWDHYLAAPADAGAAAPLLADDLAGMPPTTVIVAEFDPLRDEGLAYARRLQEANVTTEVQVVAGALHGFWWMPDAFDAAGELTADLGRLLRRW